MRPKFAVVAMFCMLGLLPSVAALAGPVGGPSFNIWHRPIAFSVSGGVGFGQRDVHNMENDDIQDEVNASNFLVKVDIAPANFIDIYGLIGAADLQLDDGDYKGILGLAYGGGIRPALFPSFWNVESNFHILLDGQYLTWSTWDEDIESTLHQAQASLILAYVMRGIAPYGGFKYDYVLVKFGGSNDDMRGDLDFGVFVGCDYYVTDEVFFNVELTIFSETRVFAGVGYKY